MLIRHAEDYDWSALGALFVEINDLQADALPGVFSHIPTGARAEAFVREHFTVAESQVFVAEGIDTTGADTVIGFVWVRLHSAPPIPLFVPRHYAEVDTLVVAERFRHRGVGRALVARAHRWAADQGVTKVQVVVWEFNAAAIGLYKQLGYETTRHTMRRSIGSPDAGGGA